MTRVQKPQVLLVLTLGLAPYRWDFFSRLALALQGRWKVVILQRSPQVARYGWPQNKPPKHLQLITVSRAKTLKQKQDTNTTLRRGFWQTPPTVRQIYEIIRWRPEMVYSSEASLFCWPALMYSVLTGVPLVLETDMGPVTSKRLSVLKRWNQWLFRKRAALILARTTDAAHYGDKTVFAPHAVHAERFTPRKGKERLGRKKPIFLFVGIPSNTKGLDLFARAAARAETKVLFECRLVGADRLGSHKIGEIFRQAGFQGPLTIKRFLFGPSLLSEYQKAAAFVFPSRFDTYGVSVHEAACCGLPLLVSHHAGASQNLVVEGKNGHVIDPENTEQFAARLVELAQNALLCKRMGSESRKLGLLYSVEKQAEKVSRRILGLTGKGSGHSLG